MRHHTPSVIKSSIVRQHRDRDVLWANFVISVWVLVAWCAYRTIKYSSAVERLQEAYGPFSMRVLLWPIAIGTMELLFWFFIFRERGNGTRLFAAFMGLVLLLRGIVVSLLTASLYDIALDPIRTFVYGYVAASHLAFAVFGREHA
jgi:hypothetical protein